jgi:hypothetical protein
MSQVFSTHKSLFLLTYAYQSLLHQDKLLLQMPYGNYISGYLSIARAPRSGQRIFVYAGARCKDNRKGPKLLAPAPVRIDDSAGGKNTARYETGPLHAST